VNCLGGGDYDTIIFNAAFLLDFLKALDKEDQLVVLDLNVKYAQVLIYSAIDPTYQYVLMPIYPEHDTSKAILSVE
jgi:DNA polymerase III sliding clamp (beta) subunit (PCNA family)